MHKSLRLQLTAWYLLFFSLLLVFFSGFLYVLLSRHLRARLDASLADTAATAAGMFQAELGEHRGTLVPAAEEALAELRLPATGLAIFAGNRMLAATRADLFRVAGVESLLGSGPVYRTFPEVGRHGARLLVQPFRAGAAGFHLAAIEPLDSVEEQLAALRQVFYLGLPLALLFAGVGGYVLAAKSLAPLAAMAEQAERITAQSLGKRLEVEGANSELGRLAAVFNELLSRLEQSFAGMRDFMADASHELRTPLAVIRGEADVSLSQNRCAAEYRESLSIIQDEARRLSHLVDDLLNLAQADAGHRPLQLEEFYLNDMLDDCYRAAQPLARQKQVQLGFGGAGDISFHGDQELLRRMVMNLLDNAIRYTMAGGSASMALDTDGSEARIVVTDTGIGIPADAVDRVFERFYRVDRARSRAAGGFGLGLAIVKWIAESHRGSVTISSRPGAGSTFTVRLPLAGATVHRAFILDSLE